MDLSATNPYRVLPLVPIERVERLEQEIAHLRELVTALFLVSLLLGAAAGWWLALLWSLTK